MGVKYIVRHGAMRFLGQFEAADATAYGRGDDVVVRSERGLEVGQVLCEATPRALGRHAVGTDEGDVGSTHGVRAAAEDESGLRGEHLPEAVLTDESLDLEGELESYLRV